MKQTRVHSEQSLVPASRPDGGTEARLRAPTLMAGEIPGSQGEVAVWKPDQSRIRREVLTGISVFGALAAAFLLSSAGFIQPPFALAVAAVVLGTPVSLYGLVYALLHSQVLHRPRYVTTDIAGIAVTTLSGTRSLAWEDLIELKSSPVFGEMFLRTTSNDRITLNLYGYGRRPFSDLSALIVQAAGLQAEQLRWFQPRYFLSPRFQRLQSGEAVPQRALPAEQSALLHRSNVSPRGTQICEWDLSTPGVQYWFPDSGRLTRDALRWFGFGFAAQIIPSLLPILHHFAFAFFGVFFLPALGAWMLADSKDPTIITNDGGIRLPRSSRTILWHEIQTLSLRKGIIGTSERIGLPLYGFDSTTKQKLTDIIIIRSGLTPSPDDPDLYLHRSLPQPPSSALPPDSTPNLEF